MDWGILLLVLLVLACPIGMTLMMRGRHRMHGGHRMHDGATGGSLAGMHEETRDNGASGPVPSAASQEARLDRLQERQDAIERKIDALGGERPRPEPDRQRERTTGSHQ